MICSESYVLLLLTLKYAFEGFGVQRSLMCSKSIRLAQQVQSQPVEALHGEQNRQIGCHKVFELYPKQHALHGLVHYSSLTRKLKFRQLLAERVLCELTKRLSSIQGSELQSWRIWPFLMIGDLCRHLVWAHTAALL